MSLEKEHVHMIDPEAFNRAAEEIVREGNRMRGLLALADELVRIGSIETAARETSGRLDNLRAEEVAARAEIAGLEAQKSELSAEVDALAEAVSGHHAQLDQVEAAIAELATKGRHRKADGV